MAGKWHNSMSSRDHSGVLEDKFPVADFSSSVIQTVGKTNIQKLKDKISSIDLKLGAKYALFMIPLFATLFLVNKVGNKQSLGTNAAIGQAKFLFQNSNIILPPDTDMQVLLNADGPVGFVRTEINFDKSLAKLTSEVDVTASPFKRVIKVTSMSEANSTGKIEIVLGLDPTNLSTSPTGNLQIAKFKIGSNTQSTNISASLTFNTTNSQVVNLDQTIFTLTSTNTTLKINPVATATPVSSTATPVSTIAPTSGPVVTSTPAAPNCNRCHRNKCDNVCTKQDGNMCPDCTSSQ